MTGGYNAGVRLVSYEVEKRRKTGRMVGLSDQNQYRCVTKRTPWWPFQRTLSPLQYCTVHTEFSVNCRGDQRGGRDTPNTNTGVLGIARGSQIEGMQQSGRVESIYHLI